jgi:CRP-like cAMP-binding protein
MGMENYLPLLQSTSLFAGLEAEALRVLLGEVGAVLRTYSRGETLVLAGQSNRRVGVVLSGAIEAYHPAASGARLPIRAVCSATCWAARAFPAR